jgi:hypothetical protein
MSRWLVLSTALPGLALAAALVSPPRAASPPPVATALPASPLRVADQAPPLPGDEPVCCLIDTPQGCSGCGQGDTCVYQTMSAHECILVVYGTRCDDRYCKATKH